jgi:hypothetical protein
LQIDYYTWFDSPYAILQTQAAAAGFDALAGIPAAAPAAAAAGNGTSPPAASDASLAGSVAAVIFGTLAVLLV